MLRKGIRMEDVALAYLLCLALLTVWVVMVMMVWVLFWSLFG